MITLPKVSETALWTARLRARDAARPRSVCNDALASRFVDGDDSATVRDLLTLTKPNESIPVRHRFIDDIVRGDEASLVIVLGAGFDTRAHRLGGEGRHFVEVDHPEVVAWKEARLSASSAPGKLERIGIDFSKETLRDKLAHLATDARVLVVAEGLFMYLRPEDGRETITTLHALFPSHRLVADLMSARFMTRYAKDLMKILDRHGITVPNLPASPVAWLEQAGYPSVQATSLVKQMEAHGSRPLPWFLAWLFAELYAGSVICVAENRVR